MAKPKTIVTPMQIYTLRHGMELTQKEFADLLGVTPETMNRWENKHFVPSASVLRILREISRMPFDNARRYLRARARVGDLVNGLIWAQEAMQPGASTRTKRQAKIFINDLMKDLTHGPNTPLEDANILGDAVMRLFKHGESTRHGKG